jgi:hypothetical protein
MTTPLTRRPATRRTARTNGATTPRPARTRAPAATARDADPTRAVLLAALHEGYEGPAWHGPSLRAALRGLQAADAAWRPSPERHNIWELVLHTAQARHLMLRRLGVADRIPVPRPMRARWWPRLPDELTAAAWRADLELLADYHQRLLDAVATVPASRLATRRPGRRHTLAEEVLGVAFHDVYHAGQIQLVKRMKA